MAIRCNQLGTGNNKIHLLTNVQTSLVSSSDTANSGAHRHRFDLCQAGWFDCGELGIRQSGDGFTGQSVRSAFHLLQPQQQQQQQLLLTAGATHGVTVISSIGVDTLISCWLFCLSAAACCYWLAGWLAGWLVGWFVGGGDFSLGLPVLDTLRSLCCPAALRQQASVRERVG